MIEDKTAARKTYILPPKTGVGYHYGFNGMEKTDELFGEGDAYDYGMRGYDARAGRWMSIDQYINDYAPISPYAFSINCPITLHDVDGNVVVDLNGNPVTISTTKGQDGRYSTTFTFAKGTTKEVIESFNKNAGTVIQAMNQTAIGRKVVKAMSSATHNISITIEKSIKYYNESTKEYSSEAKEGFTPLYGETEIILNAKGKVAAAHITIYEGTINKIKETPPEQVYVINIDGSIVAQSEFSKEEIVGATGTHEGTHSTEHSSMNILGVNPKKAEVLPNKNELKFYKQTDKKGDKVIHKK